MISRASSRTFTTCKLSLGASSCLPSLSKFLLPVRARCLAATLSRRGFLEASATVLASSGQQGGAAGVIPIPLAAMKQPSEDDLVKAARHIVPPLTADRYKGQAGKVGTIGGCREYTGAPYFAAISALKVGADLSHVFCTEGAATVIKCYSPELIVHPYLPDSGGAEDSQREKEAVERGTQLTEHWLGRFDVMVIGPGLGRDPWVHATVTNVVRALRKDNKPTVIDADGLHILKNNLDLLKGWTAATLTPNHNEFQRLADAVGVRVDDQDPSKSLAEVVSRLGGPTVVQKGSADSMSNGSTTLACTREGSPRRAGGQGDVLSGTLAAFKAWLVTNPGPSEDAARRLGVPPSLLAAYGACAAVRQASRAAFREKRRSMVAGDVILHLGEAIDALYDY